MKLSLLCGAAVALASCLAPNASGAGYFNMPTNLRQCLGYGYGPGYHAPMLLGPMMKAGIEAKRLHRVPTAFAPPPRGWANGPSTWNGGCSGAECGGWESYLATPYPTISSQQAMPEAMRQPSPAPLLYAPGVTTDGLRFE